MPTITALACTNGDVGYGEPCWNFSMVMMCDAVVLTPVWLFFWIYLTWCRTKQVFEGCMMHLNAGVLLETFDNWFVPECWCEVIFSFKNKRWRPTSSWNSDVWGYAWGFMASTFDMNVRCPHFELWSRIRYPNFDEQESTMCALPMEMAPCIVDGKEVTRNWHVWGHDLNRGKVSSEKNRIAGEGRSNNHHADCDIQYQRIATSLGAATHLTLLPRFSWFGHHLLPGAHFTCPNLGQI